MCRGWSRHQHSPSPTCRPAQPSWQIHLGNQQPAKERVKLRRLQTADFKLGRSSWQLLLLFDCLSDGRLSQPISKPRSFPPQKPAQQFDALLLSPGLSWDHLPRLKTKVVSSKVKGKTTNFFNNLQCSKAGVADIRQVRLDLKWIGVGFLDLAIFLRVVWNAGATSNINSCWKHPI